MKTILTITYGIICIAFIGFSHFLWIEKTTELQAAEQRSVDTNNSSIVLETLDSLLPLTQNWPEQSKDRLKKAIEQSKPFTIAIAGSGALGGENGWAMQTRSNLLEAYGAENINVEIREYDLTSDVFIAENKHQELADIRADMILFEPFILKNNGVLGIETTLDNVTTTIDTIKQAAPDSTIILLPANPIYNARIYPTQVASLKQYAEQNQLLYLDHWDMWPDPNSIEIKEYLSTTNSLPNEQGHKAWSEFVSAFLISK